MLKIRFILVTILLLFTPLQSYADFSIFGGVYTKHFNNNSELNENNQVIGIKYNNLAATTFVNSSFRRSHFISWRWKTDKYYKKSFYVRGNLYLGALYGYDQYVPNVLGWTLALSPTFEVGYKKVSIETLLLPFDGGVMIVLLNYNF